MDVVRHQRGLAKAEKRLPAQGHCLAIYSHRVNTQRPLAETLANVFPWWRPSGSGTDRLYRAYVEKKLRLTMALITTTAALLAREWRGRGAPGASKYRRAVRPDPGGTNTMDPRRCCRPGSRRALRPYGRRPDPWSGTSHSPLFISRGHGENILGSGAIFTGRRRLWDACNEKLALRPG